MFEALKSYKIKKNNITKEKSIFKKKTTKDNQD